MLNYETMVHNKAVNSYLTGDQSKKEIKLGYKYLDLIKSTYDEAREHPELTGVEREKVRKVL